jgi:formylglycine-generating enzyme
MQEPIHIFDAPADLKPLSEMIFVEGGTFSMGDDEQNWDNTKRTIHSVKLDSFHIGKYPVTQSVWKAVMNGDNPSRFNGDNHPVETVSWDTITEGFLPKLNELTKGSRPKDSFYRLPTEAQWEYAAKGGKYANDFPFTYSGSNKLNEVGWYRENSHDETKPVGLKTPNFLGIHDMSGNVWEWCNDWYGSYEDVIKQSKKDAAPGAFLNPIGVKQGSNRVLRGGEWRNGARDCRSTLRYDYPPSGSNIDIGFRLVLVYPSV